MKKPQVCNFLKKQTLAQVFSCEFDEISWNTLFTEHLWATAFEKVNTIIKNQPWQNERGLFAVSCFLQLNNG